MALLGGVASTLWSGRDTFLLCNVSRQGGLGRWPRSLGRRSPHSDALESTSTGVLRKSSPAVLVVWVTGTSQVLRMPWFSGTAEKRPPISSRCYPGVTRDIKQVNFHWKHPATGEVANFLLPHRLQHDRCPFVVAHGTGPQMSPPMSNFSNAALGLEAGFSQRLCPHLSR